VAVSGGLSFASVSTGFHTCGPTTNNVLYCWGYNDNGQVGDGTRLTPRVAPVRVIQ
jgi:alpha-tubulin suppressor-like RCC1 family protein